MIAAVFRTRCLQLVEFAVLTMLMLGCPKTPSQKTDNRGAQTDSGTRPAATAPGSQAQSNDGLQTAATQASSAEAQKIMQELGQSMREERDVLLKALDQWDNIDQADRDNYWAALQKQREIAAQFAAMINADPASAKEASKWYMVHVHQLHGQVTRLNGELSSQRATSGQLRTRYNQFFSEAAGSVDAMREYVKWRSNSPGSATNMYLMFVKNGYIEPETEQP
jgi:hypothetical protein